MKLFPVICWQEWQGYGKSHEDREGGEGLSGKAHFMQFIEMFTRDGFPFPTKYPTVLSFHCSDITEQLGAQGGGGRKEQER